MTAMTAEQAMEASKAQEAAEASTAPQTMEPPTAYSEIEKDELISPEEQAAKERQIMSELEQQDLEAFRQVVPAVSHGAPPPYPGKGTMLPVVIPQATTSLKGAFMCPFIRAYPPELQARGIDEPRFLQFLDGFNEAFVTSPVFEAGNWAGNIMAQFYSVHPVQIAGYAVTAASLVGAAAVSYLRAKSYVKAHNEKLFRPLGLTCNVLTTKKLIAKIGYPHEKLELLPIYQSAAEETGDSAQPTGPGEKVLTRRLQALEGYVQPLDLHVPPSADSENYLKRVGEWQANRRLKKQEAKLERRRNKSERKVAKLERKADKRRTRVDAKIDELEHKLEDMTVDRDHMLASQSAQTNPKVRHKIEKNYNKESAKIEKIIDKKGAKADRVINKRTKKAHKRRDKMDKREHKTANKVRWIVIAEWDPEKESDKSSDSSSDSDSSSSSDSESDSE